MMAQELIEINMKYQIKYIIDEVKTTKYRIRDLKLQLIQDNIDITITSDYPIPVATNNSIVFLGSTKFYILGMETHVSSQFYTIEVRVRDEETIIEMKKNDSEEIIKKSQMEAMKIRIEDQKKYKIQQSCYDNWLSGK